MKTTTLQSRNLINRSPSGAFLLISFVLACFALSPQAQAACLDGCNGNFGTFQGDSALIGNTTGSGNTAIGWFSLASNTDGSFNTGVGAGALDLNNGSENTAVGTGALLLNTTGSFSTAVGAFALINTTVGDNTAIGNRALQENTIGFFNTALGELALFSNTTGNGNTANGDAALLNNTTGSGNTALGSAAGSNMTTADNVISIGSPGDGTAFSASNRCFIGNIRDVLVGNGDGLAVIVDSDGQLGTGNASSRRFKEDIKAIDNTSEAILRLKPVTFHYKNRDTKKADDTPQFGLVAEDVAEVNPDLVMPDKDGQVSYVRYDVVNVMLLNEFLKEHREVQELKKQVEALTAGLEKVSAQLELSKAGPKTVVRNQ